MNRDDIIRMAREAWGDTDPYIDSVDWYQNLGKFATLVAAAERERRAFELAECYRCGWDGGVKAEREACALMCHELKMQNKFQNADDQYDDWNHGIAHGAELCRDAIRARGKE